jgi:hypothetical protein
MESIVMIPPLKGVTTTPIDIEPSASGNQKADALPILVVLTLYPALPRPPLVQLIQDYQ